METTDLRDAVETRAWQGFACAHAALMRDLDALLRSTVNLSLAAYAVLDHLAQCEQPGGLRLTDLAEWTQLTVSGMSRVVTTLDEQGLIERLPDPEDGRASRIALTPLGLQRRNEALPGATTYVRERFLDRFSGDELAQMADFWDRLTA